MKRVRLRTCLLAMPALAIALGAIARDVRTSGVYESQAWLLVPGATQPPTEKLLSRLTSAAVQARALAEPAVAKVPEVRKAADPGDALRARVSVGLQHGTNLIWVLAVSDSAQGAARLADAYARAILAETPGIRLLSGPRAAVANPIGPRRWWIALKFLVLWLLGLASTVGLLRLLPISRRQQWIRANLAILGFDRRARTSDSATFASRSS